jgi:hypothetical protein
MKTFKNLANKRYLMILKKLIFEIWKKIKLTYVFNHWSVPNVSSRKIDIA